MLAALLLLLVLEPPDQVLVVSVDGLRPEFYLDEKWGAPTLCRLAREGAFVRGVVGVFPSVTYPSHASIVTGVSPDRHGVIANTRWTEEGPQTDWYWEEKDLKAAPLWRLAHDAGRTVAIVNWPSTIGADVQWRIPEKWGLDMVKILDELASPGLMAGITAAQGPFEIAMWRDKAYVDRYMTGACAWVLRTHKPNLAFLHLIEVDDAQHLNGRDHDAVRAALGRVDRHVDTLLKALGPRALVAVTGDHGFHEVGDELLPNVLFKERGWFRAPDDWDVIAHVGGGAVTVYARGDRAEAARKVVEERRLRDGKPMFELLDRAALDTLHAAPGAAFALSAVEGYTFGGRASGEFVQPSRTIKGNHGALPDQAKLHTGLILHGTGVKAGAVVDRARLVDVGPTIAEALGVPMPDVEGRPLSDLLSPAKN